ADDSAQWHERKTICSALVGATHEQQSLFDASPGLRLLPLALFLEGARFLRRLGDGFGSMRIEELTRIVLDIDCLHGSKLPVLNNSATKIAALLKGSIKPPAPARSDHVSFAPWARRHQNPQ